MGFPVTCSGCGEGVPDDLDGAGNESCPRCGSTARIVHMTASSVVTASAQLGLPDLQAVTATSSLVIQAVIVPGDRTKEGR